MVKIAVKYKLALDIHMLNKLCGMQEISCEFFDPDFFFSFAICHAGTATADKINSREFVLYERKIKRMGEYSSACKN